MYSGTTFCRTIPCAVPCRVALDFYGKEAVNLLLDGRKISWEELTQSADFKDFLPFFKGEEPFRDSYDGINEFVYDRVKRAVGEVESGAEPLIVLVLRDLLYFPLKEQPAVVFLARREQWPNFFKNLGYTTEVKECTDKSPTVS